MSQDPRWPVRPDPWPMDGQHSTNSPPPGYDRPQSVVPPRRTAYGQPPNPQPGTGDPRAYSQPYPTPGNQQSSPPAFPPTGDPPRPYPPPPNQLPPLPRSPAAFSSPAPNITQDYWRAGTERTADMTPPQRARQHPRQDSAIWPEEALSGDPAAPRPHQRGERPARWQIPEAAPAPPRARPPERPRAAERPRRRAWGWSLPLEHIVLAAGILAMWYALSQPWGTDAQGHVVVLSELARQVAQFTIGGSAVLGGLLILLNKRLGCFTLLGCLGLSLVPLLVAAGIGGFQIVMHLHNVPQLTPANLKTTNIGFFLWWGGIITTLAGLVLQLLTHQRKGLIGI